MEWDVPEGVLPGVVPDSRTVLGQGSDAIIWLSHVDAYANGLVFHVRLIVTRTEESDRGRWRGRLVDLGMSGEDSTHDGKRGSAWPDVDFWILTADEDWVRVSDLNHLSEADELTFSQHRHSMGWGPARATAEMTLRLSPVPAFDGVTLRTQWTAANIETSEFKLPVKNVRTGQQRARPGG